MKLEASSNQQCFLLSARLGHAIAPPAGQAFAERRAGKVFGGVLLYGVRLEGALAEDVRFCGRDLPNVS